MMFFKRMFRYLKYLPKQIKEAWTWEFETCQTCAKAFRISWNVHNRIWRQVTGNSDGGGGSYCVDCFLKLAESKGIQISEEKIKLDLFYPGGEE